MPEALCLTAAICAATASFTNAGWERSISGIGPSGGKWPRSGTGRCSGGACRGRADHTGPRGHTLVREHSFRRH